MINGNSIVSRPSKEQQTSGEGKTIDMEQIVGQPGGGDEDGAGITGAGSRSGGGVIDFGNSVSEYATFAVQDGAKELFLKRKGDGENEKFVKQIGLENGYNDNIWQSNINKNSENNGQINSNSKNNNNIDNQHNSYRSFSARRKRFQDSDRLQISDISSDENSENSHTSFVDESDSSDLSEKATTTPTLTSTSTSNTLFSSASSIKIDTSKLKCRVERNFYLDFETYKHYSCAICYT